MRLSPFSRLTRDFTIYLNGTMSSSRPDLLASVVCAAMPEVKISGYCGGTQGLDLMVHILDSTGGKPPSHDKSSENRYGGWMSKRSVVRMMVGVITEMPFSKSISSRIRAFSRNRVCGTPGSLEEKSRPYAQLNGAFYDTWLTITSAAIINTLGSSNRSARYAVSKGVFDNLGGPMLGEFALINEGLIDKALSELYVYNRQTSGFDSQDHPMLVTATPELSPPSDEYTLASGICNRLDTLMF